MRGLTDSERITAFIEGLANGIRKPCRVYLTGGSTAVLFGWRESTIDIDVRFAPELDELFRSLPKLKEDLHINIELASPPDFIPEVPGWEDRSIFIARVGLVDYFHFDLYSQALSKLQRRHDKDLRDVRAMFRDSLIESDKLVELFERIEPMMYKYPAIDVPDFERSVRSAAKEYGCE